MLREKRRFRAEGVLHGYYFDLIFLCQKVTKVSIVTCFFAVGA